MPSELYEIRDHTDALVTICCKGRCGGKTRTAALKRSEHPLVQPFMASPNQRQYAGHIAVCTKCGDELKDFYNWSPG
jgi:hypothetical protein